MIDLESLIVKKILGDVAYVQYGTGKIGKAHFKPFIPEILKLSKMYNDTENKAVTVLNSEISLKAYLLYFLPVNLHKITALLKGLIFPENKPLKILDFGCGPGTGSLAALGYFPNEMDITLFDQSGNAEKLASNLISEFRPGIKCKSPGKNWVNGKYDLIIAANVLNEIPKKEDTTRDLIDALSEDGVLLILEPALKAKTREAMKLRDFILKTDKTLSVLFPCTHNNPCPMLKYPADWCHGPLYWEGTKLVSQIDELTGFNKHRLKYSAFVLRKNAENLPGCRVVSIPKKDKTGISAVLCCKDFYGPVKVSKKKNSESYGAFKRAGLWDHLYRPE
jgi:ribosomal protein RSM22 (predicted rRNA methylase)